MAGVAIASGGQVEVGIVRVLDLVIGQGGVVRVIDRVEAGLVAITADLEAAIIDLVVMVDLPVAAVDLAVVVVRAGMADLRVAVVGRVAAGVVDPAAETDIADRWTE